MIFGTFDRLMNEVSPSEVEGGGGSAAPTEVAAPFVNGDGTFTEGWHGRPEFGGVAGLERFKDFPSLVKSYKALESRLGTAASPAPLGVPEADAPEEAWVDYRNAHDIPHEAGGYELKPEVLPEGVEWSDEASAHFAKVFHKHHVPAAVAREIASEFTAYEAEQGRMISERYENHLAEGERQLRREWGSKYDARVAEVRSLVGTLGYDVNDAQIFSNPKIVGFLGKVVGSLSQDSVATLHGTVAGGTRFMSSAEEARAIMTDPNHPDYARYYGGDHEVIRKVAGLAGSY